MVYLQFSIVAIIFFAIFGISTAYLEYDGWINIELHHAISPKDLDSFAYRGNISIPSLNSGLSNIVQKELSSEDVENIKNLAASDSFYRLKAVVEYPNGLKRIFNTANKACNMLNSEFTDELWISIDGNGYVNSILLSTADGEFLDCALLDVFKAEKKKFNTEILIKHTELAPIPDTASFIQKIEREREARERGDHKDNRGFFAKYWMYIVPVVLLVFISGATNPEQQK